MVYRTIIHLNIELQIPVIYRADFGLRGFTPLAQSIKVEIQSACCTKVENFRICCYLPYLFDLWLPSVIRWI